jgi:spore coat polysaccharide biosynthesis predicted glycosyltransferase SpsG
MRIIIRVDIGENHGMGHAVRCKALAHALQARGAEVRFITRTLALRDFCGERFSYEFSLDGDSEHSLLYEAIDRWEASILIIDTKYPYLDDSLHYLDDNVCNIVRIDHPTAREDSCSLLVAPVAHWTTETVARLRQDFGERFLYGWDYVMLDDTVTQHEPIPYDKRAPHIVFCAGGSDPTGALEQMYVWTEGLHLDYKMLFCFGAQSHGALRQRYEDAGGESLCASGNRYIVPFHRDYLRQASLVVTMFGIAPYECLWYQTPALVFAHTDENAIGAQFLQYASESRLCSGGDIRTTDKSLFCNILGIIYAATIRQMSVRACQFDGRGVQRVAEAILGLV